MTMTKREVRRSTQFRKDLRRADRQGRDICFLNEIVSKLANDIPLPEKYRDHALTGDWKGHRECHVSPDWLLVYRKTDHGELILLLARIASHSELGF
ncbi:MAG: type II toxin-antitoxin system YafQ family toxin [Defluviitaleaceae bacterium]|nr:type II toxin-antitoxin system YafQ family toxin [Defluviitaleaceae bacterium]